MVDKSGRDPRDEFDGVVYDVESSDKVARLSQILQFSGLRVNAALDITGSFDHRARRLPYIVPHPAAVRLTGYDLHESRPNLVDEFAMSQIIEGEMAPKSSKTRMYLTFNGIRFDDEIIRTTLFRNLRYPFVTTGEGTVRVDLLMVVRMVHAMLGPKAFEVGKRADGSASFKLEDIARANGIRINAHDAMGDVIATLALATTVRERHPVAWAEAFACGNAENVTRRIAAAHDREEPCWAFTHHGKADLMPFLVIGGSKRAWLVADLRHSPDHVDADARFGSLTRGRDAPLRVIKPGSAPYVFDREQGDMFRLDRDLAGLRGNAIRWSCEHGLRERLLAAFRNDKYEGVPDPVSEERIYDGFPSWADKRRQQQFLAATDWRERAGMTFDDPRLRDFSARITLRHATHLSASERERLEDHCAEALVRPYAPSGSRWATLADATPDAHPEWLEWAAATYGQAAPTPGMAA